MLLLLLLLSGDEDLKPVGISVEEEEDDIDDDLSHILTSDLLEFTDIVSLCDVGTVISNEL